MKKCYNQYRFPIGDKFYIWSKETLQYRNSRSPGSPQQCSSAATQRAVARLGGAARRQG